MLTINVFYSYLYRTGSQQASGLRRQAGKIRWMTGVRRSPKQFLAQMSGRSIGVNQAAEGLVAL